MLKTILILLLALFFILNGINHFYNDKFLKEYAQRQGLFSPHFAVTAAGVLLLAGGAGLMWHPLRKLAVVLLCIFLLIAAFTIHRFWIERDPKDRMLEAMNFAKNLAILTELIYIGFV